MQPIAHLFYSVGAPKPRSREPLAKLVASKKGGKQAERLGELGMGGESLGWG